MTIKDFIRVNWEGTPYMYKSPLKSNGGIDPLFFVLDIIDKYYGKKLEADNFINLLELMDEAPVPEEGMFVFFKKTGHYVHHAGIMVSDCEMAHVSPSKGVTFTDIYKSQYWGPMRYKFAVL